MNYLATTDMTIYCDLEDQEAHAEIFGYKVKSVNAGISYTGKNSRDLNSCLIEDFK